jgi:RNA polymerase sigma factor (sigma-70 family)
VDHSDLVILKDPVRRIQVVKQQEFESRSRIVLSTRRSPSEVSPLGPTGCQGWTSGLAAAAGNTSTDALVAESRRPWSNLIEIGTLGRMLAGADADGGLGLAARGPVESDRVLAARLVAGEPEALAEAYRRYVSLVLGVCQRVLHDERLAEDVTQEVFVFLWRCPERFDASRGSLRAWLGLLAHHRSVDRVRAENRHTQRELHIDASELVADDIDSDVTATWLADRVRGALEQLPADQKEAVVLAYYGDRSYRQVAIELGIPEGTVKSRVRLALRRLSTLLGSDFSDQDAPAWT